MPLSRSTWVLPLLFVAIVTPAFAQSTLEEKLSIHPPSYLAKRARIVGDWERGARVFAQAGLGCTQCHAPQQSELRLGPDLSTLGERAAYQHVVESILHPSRTMEAGFQTVRLLTVDGVSLTGILRAETPEQVVLAIPGQAATKTIARDDIDAMATGDSLMPQGLVNQLEDEQQFFDLVRFVVELGSEGETGSAAERLTDAAKLVDFVLPEYENKLDHRAFLTQWNKQSLQHGGQIYAGLCVNCHGTHDKPGSLPNALAFASGKFKNGADPLSMYRTITHGYRMMLPQHQLTPQQKYDVIHYIREAYLKPHNSSQFVPVDADYLASLPQGTERGPAPSRSVPWSDMDYGPFLISTYEMKSDDRATRSKRDFLPNIAHKGIAVRLDPGQGGVSRGSYWTAFDHDTMRVAGAWHGRGFIDWHGILFDGRHGVHPRTIGDLQFGALNEPGWANPQTGDFEDVRIVGKDGRRYGPLPRSWMHYEGLYRHGDQVVVSYTVGDAPILESHSIATPTTEDDGVAWIRTLNVGRSSRDLTMRIAPSAQIVARLVGGGALSIEELDSYQVVKIAASATPVDFQVAMMPKEDADILRAWKPGATADLTSVTKGGPAKWNEEFEVKNEPLSSDGPLAVDVLRRPTSSSWNCRLQLSGLDFLPDGRMVVCSWGGDVWIISDFRKGSSAKWRRIASGLFQPLGIKTVGEKIFVGCRDQIVQLHDLNGDGEVDFYENFNSDHQVTEHFHEFAMGLQVDEAGNFYYAKSARHALDSLVPHHGTLLKVTADGEETKIIAHGFRAANGVCINPDGSFFVTDQEGHWTPMNRINRVVSGGFYGNMYGYGAPEDSGDDAMEMPLCWPNRSFDRSPAELLWLDDDRWGPLAGSLVSLSYGYGRIFVVPHENVDGVWQGGMCRLPIPDFPTGIMRARIDPQTGDLYTCGLFAWASNQSDSPGGLYRVRPTGEPLHLPVGLKANLHGITITFTEPIQKQAAEDPANYLIEAWGLKRSARYGSDQYDRHDLPVKSAALSADGKSVTLTIPDLKPTWCMEIAYELSSVAGEEFQGVIQNSIYKLGDSTASAP
ncbi:DUF6797 domain-containing protein [Blastopirellula retiformator]|uniref:Cytochrome c n=1 Tax=Blastopirellula retiformator TaxID=2527970 RepID=A0A5C5V9R4_9BACT|nr:DUF6797 domain-containing protein [Blastopirellula retiformator]TWT34435.1 Cytochrome c [Blastopirellula retiformator]